jgi:hypothetical protein
MSNISQKHKKGAVTLAPDVTFTRAIRDLYLPPDFKRNTDGRIITFSIYPMEIIEIYLKPSLKAASWNIYHPTP